MDQVRGREGDVAIVARLEGLPRRHVSATASSPFEDERGTIEREHVWQAPLRVHDRRVRVE